jgi:hypothetical protein
MEHKLNESEKMVAFFKTSVLKQIYFRIKRYGITQGIKCSKFSRPQIDLKTS